MERYQDDKDNNYQANKEKNAKKYQTNKEKIAQRYQADKKTNCQANKEKIAQRYQANKEKIAQRYQASKEKIAQNYQNNKEKIAQKYQDKKEEKQRNLKSEDRIHNFRMDIIDGPKYVCFSCKRGLFKSSVQCLDSNAISTLKTKYKIDDAFLREIGVRNEKSLIFCHNCLKYIRKNKIPLVNVQNGLCLEELSFSSR